MTLRRIVLAALLAGLVLAAFGPIVRHDFINYDDDVYILKNDLVNHGLTWTSVGRAFTTVSNDNWHPLTWLSHMVDVELFGLRPGPHHAVSHLLHLVSAVLLFLLLEALTGSRWPAFMAAGLFAVHPLHVESVAWASERKDVLVGLFFMLTLLGYLRYLRRPTRARLMAVTGLFALTLMAKPMGVTLPLVLLILDAWPLGRFAGPGRGAPHRGRILGEKIPLFLLAATSGAVTYAIQKTGGSVKAWEEDPLSIRAGNALMSYLAYLGKTVWPSRLAVFYPHPRSGMSPWLVAAALAALAGVSWLVARERRRRPHLAAGWLWYLVMLVPVIGLVQVGFQGRADRYSYLPLIGIFAAVTWEAARAVARRPRLRRAAALGGIAVLAVCAAQARIQAGYWRNSETLFRHALAVVPGNWLAANNLALDLEEQGRYREAAAQLEAAVPFGPQPVILVNLGNLRDKEGRSDEASSLYERALAVDPDLATAHYNLANLLARLGRVDEAATHYREVLRVQPGHAQAHSDLGVCLARQGRLEEARGHFAEAVRLDPGNLGARRNLERAEAMRGGAPGGGR